MAKPAKVLCTSSARPHSRSAQSPALMPTRNEPETRSDGVFPAYEACSATAGSPQNTTLRAPASSRRAFDIGPRTPASGSSAIAATHFLRRSTHPASLLLQNAGCATQLPNVGTGRPVRFLTELYAVSASVFRLMNVPPPHMPTSCPVNRANV